MAAKTSTTALTQGLAPDANGKPVQFGGSFVTVDATGTPIASPKTVSSSEIDFKVPANAIQMVISNNANALRIYETTSSTSYYVLPASSSNFIIDCAKMTDIYMIRDSADVTVQFMFVIV